FKQMRMPTGGDICTIPTDIELMLPYTWRLPKKDLHFLAYIPWNDHYLTCIPDEYHDFFYYILPHLSARTTNVHTALSVLQLTMMLQHVKQKVNKRQMYLAVMLHDCGWSEVSHQGIINSLNYSGVAPTAKSRKPKQQHVIFGEALAYKLLDAYDFKDDPLTSDDIFVITEIIRRHDCDAPWERGKFGEMTLEMQLVFDSDRLWSYTHENFWQDTVRKDVLPEAYLENLEASIEVYFFTQYGRNQAKALLAIRRKEVETYLETPHEQLVRKTLKKRMGEVGYNAYVKSYRQLFNFPSRKDRSPALQAKRRVTTLIKRSLVLHKNG
ncbi:MAG: hypothetical protein ABIR37_05020, partial [Candidatus Saccharimonadales bacterium]